MIWENMCLVYWAGLRVQNVTAFMPLMRSRTLSAAIMSYDGNVCVSVMMDRGDDESEGGSSSDAQRICDSVERIVEDVYRECRTPDC
jgi:hypothetical protein